MPLKPELKALIESDPDMTPEYKKQLTETLANSSDAFQSNWLRQADYDRKMNEGKTALQTEKTEFDGKKKEWQTWHAKADAEYKARASQVADLESKITERDTKIQELTDKITSGNFSAGEENEMAKTLQALRQEVSGLQGSLKEASEGKFISKTQLDEILDEKARTLSANIYDNTFLFSDLDFDHQREFGKRLPREEFIKFAEENQLLGNLKKAYDQFVMDARVDKKVADGVEKGLKERLSKQTFPVDNEGAPMTVMGPLQSRLQQLNKQGDGLAPNAGTSEAAMAAAAELRSEGKVFPEQ